MVKKDHCQREFRVAGAVPRPTKTGLGLAGAGGRWATLSRKSDAVAVEHVAELVAWVAEDNAPALFLGRD
jgi:hypothetical protein